VVEHADLACQNLRRFSEEAGERLDFHRRPACSAQRGLALRLTF
jgi:hypothetical protein